MTFVWSPVNILAYLILFLAVGNYLLGKYRNRIR